MDLEEFEQVVKNGQTIDFESCFAQTEDEDEIYVMRKICIEYEALTTVPTTIQKTMTPAQLYASDSPLWAYNYTEADIRNILERLKRKPKTEESFNTVLAIINNNDKNNGRMMFDEYGNIRSLGGIHGKLLQVGMSKKT